MTRIPGNSTQQLGISVVLAAISLIPGLANAAVGGGSPPTGDYNNSISFGVSRGEVVSRDAGFWGWSIAYSRRLPRGWMYDASIMWDRETEKRPMTADKVVDSYTVAATLGYGFNDWFAVTAGAGKGFASNDNTEKSMRFQAGDISVGLIGIVTTGGFKFWDRDAISVSFSYEYNVSQSEPSVSMDITFGWSY